MKQKQQSNSGHRNFSLYCKRNLSHAKKMIPIYKNLENCEKRHKKKRCLKRKKQHAHLQFDEFFFSAVSLPRLTDIIIYIYHSCAKVGFCPSYHAFHYFFFYSYLNFSVQENNATCLDFYKQCPEQPPADPPWPPGPPPQDPKVAPLMKKKNVHNYSAVDDLFSGS